MKKTTKTDKELVSAAASAFGRMGGNAVAKKLGKSHMIRIAKRGAKARWKGHKKLITNKKA